MQVNPSNPTRMQLNLSNSSSPRSSLSSTVSLANDPSLQDNYSQVLHKQISMQIRSNQLSFNDVVMVRVFHNSTRWKLELTSETNVSFFYWTLLHFQDYSVEALLGWLKENGLKYVLSIMSHKNALLTVDKIEKYKQYKLMELELELGNQIMVRESLMYRYAQMRARETMLDDYWSHMCSVIRAKNPSLLLHMTQNQTPKREAFK